MSSQAFRSHEKEDTLQRSTKNIKDGHTPQTHPPPPPLAPLNISYKGKLIRQLLSAYETTFNLLDHMQEDANSDVEEEDLCKGFASVSLSKDEKVRIRAQWSHALIIKLLVEQ